MHFDVLSITNSMFTRKQFENNILDITNMSPTPLLQGVQKEKEHFATLTTYEDDKGNPNYLQYNKSGINFIFGTERGDYLKDYLSDYNINGNSGNDTFELSHIRATLKLNQGKIRILNSMSTHLITIIPCATFACIQTYNPTGNTTRKLEVSDISFNELQADFEKFKANSADKTIKYFIK